MSKADYFLKQNTRKKSVNAKSPLRVNAAGFLVFGGGAGI